MAIDIPDEPERIHPGQDKEDLITKTGFPTVEKDMSPAAALPGAIKAIQKQVKKLDGMLANFNEEEKKKKKKKDEQKDAPATPQPFSLQSKQLREDHQTFNLRVNTVSSPWNQQPAPCKP